MGDKLSSEHKSFPLYRPELERDACGVGFLADIKGRRSHELVERGLLALTRLVHRGAAVNATADGAGVLAQIPWKLLLAGLPFSALRGAGMKALGVFFFPRGGESYLKPLIGNKVEEFGWRPVHWRRVPTQPEILSSELRDSAPEIYQLIAVPEGPQPDAERRLYLARLSIESEIAQLEVEGFSIVSFSTTALVYKGLLFPEQLPRFYPDLCHPDFDTALMIFHQRFSTNTFPRWELAQPFHVLAHNGEINTITGNRLWMQARQADPTSLPGLQHAGRVIKGTGSDSQSLDEAAELLRHSGISLPHALSRLIPPAWENDREMSCEVKAFYEFQSCFSEPWDGPAAIAFSDGRLIGALLDRNGFRPARYVRTTDDRLYLGSEAGIFDLSDEKITQRGRLGPGEMIVVDTASGVFQNSAAVQHQLATQRPYRFWVKHKVTAFEESKPALNLELRRRGPSDADDLLRRQKLFSYTREEIDLIVSPMAGEGKEAVGSMGDDTPPAVLSSRNRLLPDYFRQRFAQVTNPPMDPLREYSVMSLKTPIGARGNYLDESALDSRLLCLSSPVLRHEQVETLLRLSDFRAATIPILFTAHLGGDSMQEALDHIESEACAAVKNGAAILVLSDRDADKNLAPIPPLLATSAVHHALIEQGLRMQASLVVETGEVRDSHQMATLLAFGASAVSPYLAFETAASIVSEDSQTARAKAEALYQHALEQGLLKVFSKMGVSTLSGYCGGQLFEILGLDSWLTGRYFPDTPALLDGATLKEIAAHTLERHSLAFCDAPEPLGHPGFHVYRRDGEYHAYNPALVRQFHRATTTGSVESYRDFAEMVYNRPPTALRDLLEFKTVGAIPLSQVEPAEEICKRFFSSAMSLGALGPEAHRTIAIAMNRIGGRSNCGEGGEDPERYWRRPGEEWSNSTTKQVASARFGVTPEYLISATELQIKIAQGSKPGEGGQLPAKKVVDHIARLRHAQPGITLISPPPHHDIYSIEDIAQLIYDLKQFNPAARINVKLVAEAGVGIVAAGVAKAGAGAIQISGHSGGTGASPRGSIKHAGLPWEIGLAETQQVLTLNGLRSAVVLTTDGGLKTGRDVAVAAALGADEFGFGTAAVVAVGCVMARQCHLNTCPAGIATQRRDLRAKFSGTPDMLVNYFVFVAEELRMILAQLGLRSVQDLVGRCDLLRVRELPINIEDRFNLAPLLIRPVESKVESRRSKVNEEPNVEGRKSKVAESSSPFDIRHSTFDIPRATCDLNFQIVRDAEPLLGRQCIELSYNINNTDRTIGARLAGVMATRFGNAGLPEGSVRLFFSGSAGQSFGAFVLSGLSLHLSGETNDYLGKSMHGGEIVIKASNPRRRSVEDVLVGNTALYGATGGRVFIAGCAGERFAVRNSGAVAVVEGVGDHGCEYMTGGLVVVLGKTGRNFAAGMSGGLAFVYDSGRQFSKKCNQEMVQLSCLQQGDAEFIYDLLVMHWELTASQKARKVLDWWDDSLRFFWKVIPQSELQLQQHVEDVALDASAGK